MGNSTIILLLISLPLVGVALAYGLPQKWAGFSLSAVFFMSLVLAIVGWVNFDSPLGITYDWFVVGDHLFTIGLYVDQLSVIIAIVVALVAFLVSVFSVEYMKYDLSKSRYFALVGFFAFAMYGIIFSSNLLLTFVFWELVGFSSYLLIGFWFEKTVASMAALKAFLMNKIGDIGFLLAIFILFAYCKTLNLQALLAIDLQLVNMPNGLMIAMGCGLCLAAVGKSAQFPLQSWLPDAMTGPTPVSALIHAATMVAAGVYLMVRVFPLLSSEVLTIIGVIGGITAFMGAFSAFTQNDMKKILAFSTVSQLGYMMLAIGAGVPIGAFFHLVTHAFFKAGLFLCSGSIMHYFHETNNEEGFDAQDIRNMGGLRKVLPVTFWAFTICMSSLVGLPLFSGFLSKEMILNPLFGASHLPSIIIVFGFAVVFMTAVYMARFYFKVFFNSYKISSPYSEPLLIKSPLVILAVLSLGFVFSSNPFAADNSALLSEISSAVDQTDSMTNVAFVPSLSIGLTVLGLLFSFLYVEKRKFQPLLIIIKKTFYNLSKQHFYVDALFLKRVVQGTLLLGKYNAWIDKVIDQVVDYCAIVQVVFAHIISWTDRFFVDGLVNGVTLMARMIGERTRNVQNGNLQDYLTWSLFGLLLIFYFLILS